MLVFSPDPVFAIHVYTLDPSLMHTIAPTLGISIKVAPLMYGSHLESQISTVTILLQPCPPIPPKADPEG